MRRRVHRARVSIAQDPRGSQRRGNVGSPAYCGVVTQSVYHTGYEIALNLSRDDLGHPSRPGLWEEIYRHYQPGVLLCMECRERDPGCPQYMYVKIARGRRFACHINTGIRHASENESPRHKALKERVAAAAEQAGYQAMLEDRGPGGLRITDVLIRGAGGILVGCEVQISYITPDAVLSRSDLARQDGIVPMWTVDDVKAAPIDRACAAQKLDRVVDLLVSPTRLVR